MATTPAATRRADTSLTGLGNEKSSRTGMLGNLLRVLRADVGRVRGLLPSRPSRNQPIAKARLGGLSGASSTRASPAPRPRRPPAPASATPPTLPRVSAPTDRPWAGRRLHFVGIGGAGMSGLALVARALGAEVTGSDRAESSYTERLRAAGIVPTIGHASANVPSGAEVVVSTAIAEDNIELAAARAGGSRVMHRSDLLAEIAALGRAIAITGTHGKTTTAAMAAHALVEAGRDPAYLIGGVLRSTGTNAAWGEGGWIVVEADESDRSFLKLSPEVAVVTNVELDHHATYASVDELERAMADFAASAPVLVAGEDVPGRIAGAGKRTVRYGRRTGDLTAHELALRPLGARFRVDDVLVELTVPGRHNVLNALAAIAACREAGLPVAEAATGLASYAGAG